MSVKMILLILLIFLTIVILALVLFVNLAPQFGGKPSSEHRERYNASVNYHDGYFHNLVNTPVHNPDVPFMKSMRDYFAGGADRVPDVKIPFNKIDKAFFENKSPDDVRITWLGHSSILIQFEGLTLLTDPMFGKRASPASFMGPKRFSKELPLDAATVPHLDAIIVSHDHYDHLDYETIKVLHQKTDKFIVPLGVAPHLLRWGVDQNKIIELDWWEGVDLSGVELFAAPSRHFSGRRGNDRNKTLWASWVIKSKRHRIYFGSDSGYGDHFQEIGEKFGPFDLTMLENGAYNEAWPNVHMMPEQTAQAHLDLRGEVLLPIHWAQFNLSLHPWQEPIERLSAAARELDITLATPMIGERFSVGNEIPRSTWWHVDR